MTDFFTVKQFAARHPAWTEASLRDLILKSEDRLNSRGEKVSGNGLVACGAVVRLGRRVLISENAFLAWVRGAAQTDGNGVGAMLRFAVLRRDRFCCVLCGSSAARGAILHVDHKFPKALGGHTSLENLQTTCEMCNLGKGATTT